MERLCPEGGRGRGQHGRRSVGAKAAPNSWKEPTLLPRSCCRTCLICFGKTAVLIGLLPGLRLFAGK